MGTKEQFVICLIFFSLNESNILNNVELKHLKYKHILNLENRRLNYVWVHLSFYSSQMSIVQRSSGDNIKSPNERFSFITVFILWVFFIHENFSFRSIHFDGRTFHTRALLRQNRAKCFYIEVYVFLSETNIKAYYSKTTPDIVMQLDNILNHINILGDSIFKDIRKLKGILPFPFYIYSWNSSKFEPLY